jgi:uncharacterized membrane protein
MARWLRFYQRLSRKLGFRATLYCVMGVLAALVAKAIGPYISEDFSSNIGAEAVDEILVIIASSMLAVTTFSLSTMVAATSAASNSATPRASKLLIEDSTAQRALSTFLGAFLFSLVGLIALKTNFYGPGGRLVLFLATLVVITIIVVTLLRWIAHLSRLGRLGETIERVEAAAIESIVAYQQNPAMGGKLFDEPPADAIPVYVSQIGYIEHLEMSELNSAAEAINGEIYMMMRPGGFCVPGRPVAYIKPTDPYVKKIDDEFQQTLCDALNIADSRTFEDDPRFGLIVLCEISSRALSPAVNDPGTAIDVLNKLTRVLSHAVPIEKSQEEEEKAVDYPRVHVRPIRISDLLEDAFLPLTRDGAGMIEVGIKIQKTCAALGSLHPAFRGPAMEMSRAALDRAMQVLTYEGDKQRLEEEAVAVRETLSRFHDSPCPTMLV